MSNNYDAGSCMEKIKVRLATVEDAKALLEIYAYYVEHTAITFEYEVPTLEEFRNRIANTLKKYPYFVVLVDNKIMGYAYAGAFGSRAAYAWSAEMTVYVACDTRKKGLGKILYAELEQALKDMGILNLYACIAYPEIEDEFLTQNSALFHEHMGYRTAGVFQNCGFKFNRWYHMIWMEKVIGEHGNTPMKVLGYDEIK